MRKRRARIHFGRSYHHVMSRTINGEALLGEREKEVFRRMMWQIAEFSGVRIVTYAVLSNHFHILLATNESEEVGDEELMRRYRVLYPKPTPHMPGSIEVLKDTLAKGGIEAEALRRRLRYRMHDVSWFVRTLKQRFSVWYNATHGRFGVLWAERFKSVLVEGESHALRTVAAYIDLNPLRVGLVEDPKDYRYCGYGEALGGSKAARQGLSEVGCALTSYRQTLFGKGSELGGKEIAIDKEKALAVIEKEKGKLPLSTLLRCRVKYFTQGAVLGSEDFVAGFMGQEGEGMKRAPKMQALAGAVWGGLVVARKLHSPVIS